MNIDPMAESFFSDTPYNYTLNNPISNIDPDGRFTLSLSGQAAQDFARNLQRELDQEENKKMMQGDEEHDPPGGKKNPSLKERIATGFLTLVDNIGGLGAVVNGDKSGDFVHNLGYVQAGMQYITDQSLFIYGINQINRAPSEGEMKVNYAKNEFNGGKLIKSISPTSTSVYRGAIRSAKYSKEWNDASLSDAINKFAPNSAGYSTAKGKTIYNNSKTGIQVVHDIEGNYFRIENTNMYGKRSYLDMNGNIPNNKTVSGKQMGRSQKEYNQVTHFNNID